MKTDDTRTLGCVVIIDDDDDVRNALQRLLESAGHGVRAYGSAEAYLESDDEDAPGCMLLDVTLPGMSGLDLLARLGAGGSERSAAPVIMISGRADVPDAVRAMKSGASEFLMKPLVSDDVLTAVDRVFAAYRQSLGMAVQEREACARVESLTRRETEVLRLIVAGRLNKQMAVELGISQKTIEFHRARVMRKLDVTCMAELMRVAFLGGVRDLYEPAGSPSSDERTLVEA